VLHLVDLTPARSWGASTLIPFFGGLTSIPVSPTLQPTLPERTWIYEYDSATDTVGFSAQGSNFEVSPARQPASARPSSTVCSPHCHTCWRPAMARSSPSPASPGVRSTSRQDLTEP
jgi:hypothetical protein